MAYITLEKQRWGASLPNSVLRVNKKSIAMSPDIAELFQGRRKTTDSGRETVSLGMAIDTDTNRIKLIPEVINGFSWTTNASTTSKSLTIAQPRSFMRAGMPKGDYVCTNKKTLEFELAQ